MKFRIIVLLITIALSLSISACSKNKISETTNPSNTVTEDKIEKTTISNNETTSPITTVEDTTTTATTEPISNDEIPHESYVLTGEILGEYGRMVILNANTDMPVEKYLYKLPVGTYTVTTTNDKMSSFFIVKDEIAIDEDNNEYPEYLQHVGDGGEGYILTNGDSDFNGHAKKSVTVRLEADESFQLVYNDTFIFERISD